MERVIGLEYLTDFWRDMYLRDYIPAGGSKIRFVMGRPGSGKTTFLRALQAEAEGYSVVSFSANDVWLSDFSAVYAEVFRQVDLEKYLKVCAEKVIIRMGYKPSAIPDGYSFLDYLADQGDNDAITKREIRNQLKELFLNNPALDNNFALAVTLLTGGILGHPVLEDANRELLLQWMRGDRTVKLAALRTLGLSPAKITRYNARYMLRSLCEIIHLGGGKGLLILIDDLDIMLNQTGSGNLKYTRMRREDAYESIRQLIDDIDNMHYVMFVFAFDRSLADDERNGLRSYQALWMRIQSEVVGKRFNRFADMTDMDRMIQQVYTPEMVVQLSEILAEKPTQVLPPLDYSAAKELLQQSRTGAFGLPAMIRNAVIGGMEHV